MKICDATYLFVLFSDKDECEEHSAPACINAEKCINKPKGWDCSCATGMQLVDINSTSKACEGKGFI